MKYFIAFVIFLYSVSSYSMNKITFSSGAALDTYQVQTITPKLTKAFSSLGFELEVKHYPSNRSLLKANSGTIDGELHRVKDFHKVSNHEYPNLIRIEYKMMSVWLSLFSIDKNIQINSWKDLSKYSVSYYRGRKNVESLISQIIPANQISLTNSDLQSMHMLRHKRVDIVISESYEGHRIIESNKVFDEIIELKKMNETQIYSYIHKKHKYLIKKLEIELNK